jgi:ParB/RepB/Spo0J family partition protein
MELEFHQIDLRYETLRRRDPRRERQLLASIGDQGQVCPVVVLAAGGGRYILLDGYKRVRALQSLKRDTVLVMLWELEEAEALVLEGVMRGAQPASPLDQGLLLGELADRFRMNQEELGRRFDRSSAWISRRLALVRALPKAVQNLVLLGKLSPDTAMKVLVPLSRDNAQDVARFAEAIVRTHLSTREARSLHTAWLRGKPAVRERLLADPALFLRARASVPKDAGGLLADLHSIRETARKALARIEGGTGTVPAIPPSSLQEPRMACEALFMRLERELAHA